MKMVNDLEAIKKKRLFLRKFETDTLKSIDEALSIPDNQAGIQVLKTTLQINGTILKKFRPQCVLY